MLSRNDRLPEHTVAQVWVEQSSFIIHPDPPAVSVWVIWEILCVLSSQISCLFAAPWFLMMKMTTWVTTMTTTMEQTIDLARLTLIWTVCMATLKNVCNRPHFLWVCLVENLPALWTERCLLPSPRFKSKHPFLLLWTHIKGTIVPTVLSALIVCEPTRLCTHHATITIAKTVSSLLLRHSLVMKLYFLSAAVASLFPTMTSFHSWTDP